MAQSDRDDAADAAGLEATAHAETPPEPVQWMGRVLDGRYKVTSLLGEGGMGAVYVAEHLTLHKEVALKVIRAELAGNGEVATRFAREAMATAQFEHPHVASAIDYGTLPEGGAYFVMQLVRGRSLRHLLARHRNVPWRRGCMLAAQVADALSAAKAAGIIHRDLKPDNILVQQREDGSDLVKVLDFGIAHVAPRDAPAPEGAQADRQLTRVGTVMGTPGYMPPEQAVGDTVDYRADLYSLGVVLWECIAGRELWEAPDLTSTITRQMTETVPSLREEVDLTIPAALDSLLRKLLAREPGDRPDHAGTVRDELRRLALAEGGARPTVPLVPAIRDAVAPAVSTVVSRFRTQPRNRQMQMMGVAVGVALLLAVVLFAGGDESATGTAASAGSAATAEASEGKSEGQDKDNGKGKGKDESAGAKGGTPTENVPAHERGEEQAAAAAKPEPPTEEPSAIEKVVDAGEKVLPGGPKVPDELVGPVDTMLHGNTIRARRRAAKRVLAYKPKGEVPLYLRNIAAFETARGCKTRKAAIRSMTKKPHPEYLEPLWRMRRAPKTGCGFLSLSDCYACVRPNLRSAISKIGKRYPAAAKRAAE